MRSHEWKRGILAAIGCFLLAWQANAAQTAAGTITDVTVYRDQALVTREILVEGPKGQVEVVVTGLPARVALHTLAAEAPGGSRIHSVTSRTKAIADEGRPEVREIDDQLESLKRDRRSIEARQQLLETKRTLISNLQQFTSSTSAKELQSGVLDSKQLTELAEYGLAKHLEIMEEGLALAEEDEEIGKQMELLQRKRGELQKGLNRSDKQALIYLTKDSDAPVAIQLTYLVTGVSWTPQYNLRTGVARDSVLMEYNARVSQMSGENWIDVNLTFSTAQPSFTCEPPVIEPLKVALAAREGLGEQEIRKKIGELQQKRQSANQIYFQNIDNISQPQGQQTAADFRDFDGNFALNEASNARQILEINNGRMAAWKPEPSRLEGVSVTYSLNESATLASRSDEKILQIASVHLPANFYYVAMPVLTDYVYEEAEIVNTSEYVFLPGEFNAYANGEFVGRGLVKLAAIGEGFKAGFGVNPQIQVSKDQRVESERVEGGNKVTEFKCTLKVANYSDNAAPVKLIDRIPYSDSSQARIELLESSPELSDDKDYRNDEEPKGILRWDLDVSEQSIEDNVDTVTYRFKVVHERIRNGQSMMIKAAQ